MDLKKGITPFLVSMLTFYGIAAVDWLLNGAFWESLQSQGLELPGLASLISQTVHLHPWTIGLWSAVSLFIASFYARK